MQCHAVCISHNSARNQSSRSHPQNLTNVCPWPWPCKKRFDKSFIFELHLCVGVHGLGSALGSVQRPTSLEPPTLLSLSLSLSLSPHTYICSLVMDWMPLKAASLYLSLSLSLSLSFVPPCFSLSLPPYPYFSLSLPLSQRNVTVELDYSSGLLDWRYASEPLRSWPAADWKKIPDRFVNNARIKMYHEYVYVYIYITVKHTATHCSSTLQQSTATANCNSKLKNTATCTCEWNRERERQCERDTERQTETYKNTQR